MRRSRHRRVRELMAVCCILFGVLLIVAAVVFWSSNRSTPTEFGAPASVDPAPAHSDAPSSASAGGHEQTRSSAAAPQQPSTALPEQAGEGTAQTPSPNTGAVTAAPPVLAAGAGEEPVTLGLPTLGVDAAVEHVGVIDGVLGVPTDVSRVGWWSAGSRPGAAAGSVVIDGHVDDVTQGPGAFFSLGQLVQGDTATVKTAGGAVLNYRVVALQIFDKSEDLPPDLFTSTGPPRLVLITCGGEFDQAALSYTDNIVVFAEPVA
jgi:hypothetical protein